MFNMKFLARPGQSLENHLIGVGEKASCFAAKIGLGEVGELIGLLHDFGQKKIASKDVTFRRFGIVKLKQERPGYNPQPEIN